MHTSQRFLCRLGTLTIFSHSNKGTEIATAHNTAGEDKAKSETIIAQSAENRRQGARP